jgi:PiT family inorganic phosphate transporter
MLTLLIVVIVVTLIFDFINGFHDAANAIATVVSTGVLPVRTAVILAGIANFAGAIMGTAVAKTIANGFTDPAMVTLQVVLATLIGAIVWNLLTWWYGIPSSSSHALIGGLCGAVVAHGGIDAFKWPKLVEKVLVPLVVSPLFGFVLAIVVMVTLLWIFRKVRPAIVNSTSRSMQLVSAMVMATAHGSNDAQKSMGIMMLALLIYAQTEGVAPLPAWAIASPDEVPRWVVISCGLAIGLGTMGGGKKIIKTMGTKIIRISPLQGFAAEMSGAATIFAASHYGIPLSTTHCINSSIMGVGASRRISAVRWGVAGNMMVAWVLTIPATATIAAVTQWLLERLLG